MKPVSISGSTRSNVGKKDAKALRTNEQVPCVLYGGKEQIHFSVPEPQFKNLVYTPDVHTVDLSINDKKYSAILQEAQFHKITDKLLHVDFLELTPGKPVIMNIPVRTTGVSPGVKNGGKLHKKLKTLRVKGLIENMPDEITVPIDTLEVGGSVRISDINTSGLTFLNAPNVTVVTVQITRAVMEEAKPGAPAAGTPAAAGATAAGAKAAAPAAGATAPKAAPAKK